MPAVLALYHRRAKTSINGYEVHSRAPVSERIGGHDDGKPNCAGGGHARAE